MATTKNKTVYSLLWWYLCVCHRKLFDMEIIVKNQFKFICINYTTSSQQQKHQKIATVQSNWKIIIRKKTYFEKSVQSETHKLRICWTLAGQPARTKHFALIEMDKHTQIMKQACEIIVFFSLLFYWYVFVCIFVFFFCLLHFATVSFFPHIYIDLCPDIIVTSLLFNIIIRSSSSSISAIFMAWNLIIISCNHWNGRQFKSKYLIISLKNKSHLITDFIFYDRWFYPFQSARIGMGMEMRFILWNDE